MDQNGKERHIRYVADINGFRAFGDLVPDDTWVPPDNTIPKIGSSVVPAVPSSENNIIDNIILDTNLNLLKNDKVPPSAENSILKSDVANPQLNNINPDGMQILVPGTTIVILKKILPTMFAELPRVGDGKIKPRPVKKTGSFPEIITGKLTDPRAKSVLYKDNKAKSFPTTQLSKIVPQPSKVDGMVNLDNFFKPAPGIDYNYDYNDYYDYTDIETTSSNVTSQSPKPSSSNVTSQSPKPSSSNVTSQSQKPSSSNVTSQPPMRPSNESTTSSTQPIPATFKQELTTTSSTTTASSIIIATKIDPKPNLLSEILNINSNKKIHRTKTKKQRSTRSEESIEESQEFDSEEEST